MEQFLNLIDTVLTKGKKRMSSVQGPGTIVYPGYEMRFRMEDGFPLITTRSLKGSWKAMVHELLWFLSGSDDVSELHKNGVHLWDSWAAPEICARYGLGPRKLGPIYGPQWRHWRTRDGGEIDQISNVLHEITNFPDSKRMTVTAWNPEDIDKVFIAPCHVIFKFTVAEGGLYLNLWQRSADLLVGVPFNIAEYALLLRMVAQVVGLKPIEFVHHLSDVHIYFDQVEFAKLQFSRDPRPLPRVKLNQETKDLFSFRFEDFTLDGYDPHPPIKGIPVGV
ncbi:thymidylate synthase [Candidatus Giovannonibacteria bacterium RIFCSPHIGHO2_01_FULL_45_24]|uniref:Thymidylate synthase n=1 Tax=Candidatus Giovannonibacteria bacterium RIFCSPLOWO2_01_FULL_46_32 TaxID=1798353 RepID=A0A1F5XGQ2_9BACT|nr:MAG: thymidylate synthase [Candidatus Giovannonibacteria bacterium RIFCSPHIGHO2_01_FULL_45_24]OGF87093.1 MAG: thymidylate synthase [Candidatus Giovannonibacteria bacterium RIFCSPLOWO2_01_FULL_46_32]